MSLARILKEQKEVLRPSKEELARLNATVVRIRSILRAELARHKQKAQVFVGGSFAKGTLVKRNAYDVDIFVRFSEINEGTLAFLERCVNLVGKEESLSVKRVHGSRDYFQLTDGENATFEVIPVKWVNKPAQAENVTDLSYFHVAYIAKKTRKREDDIRLAKQFCLAQGVYGAESYIRGFSGYGVECLIIHYKGFLPFLRALTKAKTPLILDPAHHFKNAFEITLSLNEAKIHNPIVLVDPTYKERNVLAALSQECFEKLQKAARLFLAHPTSKAFEERTFDRVSFATKAQRQNARAVTLILTTDRQAGDIAGTKLKKSSLYLVEQFKRWFAVKSQHFEYDGEHTAMLHLALVPRGTIEQRGPFIRMKEACVQFKKAHKKTFVKSKRLWAKISITMTPEQALKELLCNREQLYRMGLVDATLQDAV